MKINPVCANSAFVLSPNFKAKFAHNEISKDLLSVASAEDVAEFNLVCENLKQAKNDQYTYLLVGNTSAFGDCCEMEIADRYVDLVYKRNKICVPGFLQSWIIRGENVVSGGVKKENLLKEVTKKLKNIALQNEFHPNYNPKDIILKKANCISKIV